MGGRRRQRNTGEGDKKSSDNDDNNNIKSSTSSDDDNNDNENAAAQLSPKQQKAKKEKEAKKAEREKKKEEAQKKEEEDRQKKKAEKAEKNIENIWMSLPAEHPFRKRFDSYNSSFKTFINGLRNAPNRAVTTAIIEKAIEIMEDNVAFSLLIKELQERNQKPADTPQKGKKTTAKMESIGTKPYIMNQFLTKARSQVIAENGRHHGAQGWYEFGGITNNESTFWHVLTCPKWKKEAHPEMAPHFLLCDKDATYKIEGPPFTEEQFDEMHAAATKFWKLWSEDARFTKYYSRQPRPCDVLAKASVETIKQVSQHLTELLQDVGLIVRTLPSFTTLDDMEQTNNMNIILNRINQIIDMVPLDNAGQKAAQYYPEVLDQDDDQEDDELEMNLLTKQELDAKQETQNKKANNDSMDQFIWEKLIHCRPNLPPSARDLLTHFENLAANNGWTEMRVWRLFLEERQFQMKKRMDFSVPAQSNGAQSNQEDGASVDKKLSMM